MSQPNAYSAAWFGLFLTGPDPVVTAREVAFVASLLSDGARVLDVCCGYGRHAIPLARLGHRVLGIDRDAGVIGRAWVLAGNSGATFETRDMTDLVGVPGPFDAVICLWQSFGYGDAGTNFRVLGDMTGLLAPGGRLVLDIYYRDFFAARQGVRTAEVRGTGVTTRQHLDGDRLTVELDYSGREERDVFSWQVFTPATITALAARFGLALDLSCTGFDPASPPTADTPRMQLVFARHGCTAHVGSGVGAIA